MVIAQQYKVRLMPSQKFRLSFEGEAQCMVKVGDPVKPETPVFEGRTSEVLQSINLNKELGVRPHEAGRYVMKEEGEIVDVGDIIARRSVAMGTAERIVRAHTDGRLMLDNISAGFAEIRAPFNDTVVKAGVHGKVARIYPERMGRRVVDLDVTGFVSEPFHYVGQSVSGELFLLKQGNSLYRPGEVDDRCADKIVVAGRSLSVALYEALAEQGARGIIVGGMPKTEFEILAESRIPIFIMEGWGIIPVNTILFQVLKEYEGNSVCLDGEEGKLVISPSGKSEALKEPIEKVKSRVTVVPLEKGADVQVWDIPYWGYSGKARDVLDSEELVRVVLDSGRTITVPSRVVTAIAEA